MKKIKTLKQHSEDLHNKSFSHHTANHRLILKRLPKNNDLPDLPKSGKHSYAIYSPDGDFIGTIISHGVNGVLQTLKGKGYEIDKK